MIRHVLHEQAKERIRGLSAEQITEIRRAIPGIVIEPGDDPDSYDVHTSCYVGTVRLDFGELCILPKLTIERVLFLWSYSFDSKHWRDREVEFAEAPDLINALAHAFALELELQLRSGFIEDYQPREENERAVRGRIMLLEQWGNTRRRRPAVACAYDEYTVDILENQLLKEATRILRAFLEVDQNSAKALARCAQELLDVSSVRFARQRIPEVLDRPANRRYKRAIELARLILSRGSFELHEDDARALRMRGLLFDMNRVFEEFVRTALRRALRVSKRAFGSTATVPEGVHLHLDSASAVRLQPDLLWVRSGDLCFVGDVKYKKLAPSYMPNADIYQMLAYLVGSGVDTGMLIYPKSEDEPWNRDIEILIDGRRWRILVRIIDLEGPSESILTEIDRLAKEIRAITASALEGCEESAWKPPEVFARGNRGRSSSCFVDPSQVGARGGEILAARRKGRNETWTRLFEMRPHSQNVNNLPLRLNLVNEAVLDVDSAGVVAGQVAYKFFESGRCREGIVLQKTQQLFCLILEPGGFQLLGVSNGLG